MPIYEHTGIVKCQCQTCGEMKKFAVTTLDQVLRIQELEQQNARLREFVLAVKEMREAQLNAGATGYRNGAFNAAQREAEKKVNEILEAL